MKEVKMDISNNLLAKSGKENGKGPKSKEINPQDCLFIYLL